MRKRGPEETEQGKLLDELAWRMRPDVHVYAIANGELRHIMVALKLKNQGVKRGIADLVFIAPNGVSAWLEMKGPKGRLSDEQLGFQAICKRNGHIHGVAKSAEEGLAFCREHGFLKVGL